VQHICITLSRRALVWLPNTKSFSEEGSAIGWKGPTFCLSFKTLCSWSSTRSRMTVLLQATKPRTAKLPPISEFWQYDKPFHLYRAAATSRDQTGRPPETYSSESGLDLLVYTLTFPMPLLRSLTSENERMCPNNLFQ
jgi:hypothetical protein